VERVAGYTGLLWAHEVIGIFQGDIRTEIADDLLPPAVVEMINVFQKLFAVHSE